MNSIKNTLNFMDFEEDVCAHFTYYVCGCGCNSCANLVILDSCMLEEPMALEVKEKDAREINPLEMAKELLGVFEKDGLLFELVSINSEIVE